MLAAASQKPIPPAPSDFSTGAEIRQQLPSVTAARKLAEHYFTDIYPRLPFFSTQGFWAQFEHVYGFSSQSTSHLADAHVVSGPSRSESSLNQGQISPRLPPSIPNSSEPAADSSHGYDIFTVAIVLAISASSLSSSSTSVIYGKANSLFQTAIRFRESISFANTVAGVQSILFLIQFANLNPSSLDAWYLIGVGMRTCIDLGLHQDPQPPSSVSPSLLETRRRIWWSMYSFDRSMSLSCCRPMEVSDSVITALLPTFRIGLISENQAEAVSTYLQRYRILQIQSFIYDRLNEQWAVEGEDGTIVIRDLAEKLENWSQNNSSADSTGLMRHELLMGKMLLYRPCRLIPDRALYDLEELWRSVLAFAQIYRALAASNSLFYVRIASEKAYWTGLAMLFCYWRLAHHPHTSVLLRPSELWTATRDVSFVLQALSERWSQGKVLYSRFEDACTRVIKATEPDINGANRTAHNHTEIPEEVRTFCNYSSLTSIWTAGREKGSSEVQAEELRDLALTLEGWQEA
ncbi:fungal-specific transcription factor domain-containing protein [Aspergillus pseudoustus]|uniref:Fungal-specific transcription factor domain-containing protein n=1 Tax=Aspergillus pseudoustus TaxID=1810923 RepID=A0ABR4K0D6_9EURO